MVSNEIVVNGRLGDPFFMANCVSETIEVNLNSLQFRFSRELCWKNGIII